MEAGVESFGTLRLVRGGKHGYVGVRGRQGKKRNEFQAYVAVDGKKKTVSGLWKSAHAAAVALAQWKQNRELGLEDEPNEKQPRKKRGTNAAEQLATAAGTSASSWQMQRTPQVSSSQSDRVSHSGPASMRLSFRAARRRGPLG